VYDLKRCHWIDEELRDRFLELRAAEALMIALNSLMAKSKTRAAYARSRASQPKTSDKRK
jgi:hypothetical protein